MSDPEASRAKLGASRGARLCCSENGADGELQWHGTRRRGEKPSMKGWIDRLRRGKNAASAHNRQFPTAVSRSIVRRVRCWQDVLIRAENVIRVVLALE
jgi:hypothetical protein